MSGPAGLSYGQLSAAREAARCLLDSGVLIPAERDGIGQVIARMSAVIQRRPADLASAHERWPGWQFSQEGEQWAARSGDGLCTLRADSPEAVEEEVRREEQLRARVRAFAGNSHWRTADG